MKKCPAAITDRGRASQRGLNMFATFMRKTSMMILYYITIWASPRKPLFRICVQKHSSRTHRFPVLPLDFMALLDSADLKLEGRERSIVRWKSGTPASIPGVPLLIYLQEAGSNNSISLFLI